MKEDIKCISPSVKEYVPADKASNTYESSKQKCNNPLNTYVTRAYKKVPASLKFQITNEAKSVLKDQKIIIILKVHKSKFDYRSTTGLIDPAKMKKN